jgi:hypothetical protein
MKFKSDLDYYDNMNRFSDRDDWVALDSLSKNERECLLKLNAEMGKIEERYWLPLYKKHTELNRRKADPLDHLEQYSLTLIVRFYLTENDPEYEQDDKNLLMEVREDYSHDSSFYMLFQHATWNDLPDHRDEHHCHLYHCLYDHYYLNWRDLLRIGSYSLHIETSEEPKCVLIESETLANDSVPQIRNSDASAIEYETLTSIEKINLEKLNRALAELEDENWLTIYAKFLELKGRAANSTDELVDFTLTWKLVFFMREDDPEYNDESDNVIAEICEDYSSLGCFKEVFNDANWSARCRGKGGHYSHLYHVLANQQHVSWNDLLRIGDCCVELVTVESAKLIQIE